MKTEKQHHDAIIAAVNAVHGALASLRFALAEAAQDGVSKETIKKWLNDAGYSSATIDRRIRDAFGRVEKEHKHKGGFKKDTLATADALLASIGLKSKGNGTKAETTDDSLVAQVIGRIASYAVDNTKDAKGAEKKANELVTALKNKVREAVSAKLAERAEEAKGAKKSAKK